MVYFNGDRWSWPAIALTLTFPFTSCGDANGRERSPQGSRARGIEKRMNVSELRGIFIASRGTCGIYPLGIARWILTNGGRIYVCIKIPLPSDCGYGYTLSSPYALSALPTAAFAATTTTTISATAIGTPWYFRLPLIIPISWGRAGITTPAGPGWSFGGEATVPSLEHIDAGFLYPVQHQMVVVPLTLESSRGGSEFGREVVDR